MENILETKEEILEDLKKNQKEVLQVIAMFKEIFQDPEMEKIKQAFLQLIGSEISSMMNSPELKRIREEQEKRSIERLVEALHERQLQ